MSFYDKVAMERLSKKILIIRKSLGYATKYQQKEGWKGELRFIKGMAAGLRRKPDNYWLSCGGFKFVKKKDCLYMIPEFQFRISMKMVTKK
jgi:hypothetical protein